MARGSLVARDMDSLLSDLRYAVRTLVKSPGFTLVAVLTLALGIGANTAIFSVLYGVLFRPLPYPEPERLVGLSEVYQGRRNEMSVTYRELLFLQDQARIFESAAGWTSLGFNVFTGTESDHVNGLRVSKDFFRVLGVAPEIGRNFSAEEDQFGGPDAVILSHGYWARRFGGDRSIVRRSISLDGRPYTVVGVMPARFQTEPAAEVWSTLAQVSRTVGSGQNLELIARLRPGLSAARADADFAATISAFREQFKAQLPRDVRIELYPQRQLIVSDLRTPVRILFGAIGFVLLIACANVASLILGRAAERGRELAVRVAMGATGARLMRQLLTESLLLALVGGAAGLVIARWGLDSLLTLLPPDLTQAEIRLDWWAVLFTFAISLFAGVAFGLLPAWHAARSSPHDALKEGSVRTTGAAHQGRVRNALVVGEIALSLVLLVGAGLLIRTMANLLNTDPGFDRRRILAAEIWITGSGHDSTAQIAGFYDRLVANLEAVPGVQAAAVVESGLPLEWGGNLPVAVDGEYLQQTIDYRTVTPGFFRTLGIPLVQGRNLAASDAAGSEPAVVVNATFARRFLSGGPTLGRKVTVGGRNDASSARDVVGVVGDVKSLMDLPARPTVFIPSAQTPAGLTRLFSGWFPIHVVVRTAGDPGSLAPAVEGTIHRTDPRVPVGRVLPMLGIQALSVAFRRFVMLLLSAFAALALALAAVGIYGVMSYLVTQRTHEIGVRMALGAVPRDLLGMVVGRGLLLAAIGVVLGLAGAAGLTRLLSSQLFGVKPVDPVTFAGVAAVLVVVALVACYVPARLATKVDPVVALRSE